MINKEIKKNTVESDPNLTNQWFLIDAKDQILGRLSSFLAIRLMGKHKPSYTDNECIKDKIIVINAKKIILTGKKLYKKKYWHTGYPGGIKFTSPERLMKNKPEEILKLAVKRMLSRGPLAKKQLSKLKMYKGTDHPHESQNPKIIDFAKMNRKNYISVN